MDNNVAWYRVLVAEAKNGPRKHAAQSYLSDHQSTEIVDPGLWRTCVTKLFANGRYDINMYVCCKVSSLYHRGNSTLLISAGRLMKLTFCKHLEERTVANLVLCVGGEGHGPAYRNDHHLNSNSTRCMIQNYMSEKSQFAGTDPAYLEKMHSIPNAVKKRILESRIRRKVPRDREDGGSSVATCPHDHHVCIQIDPRGHHAGSPC